MLRFFIHSAQAIAEIEYDISTPIPSSGAVKFTDINEYVSAIFSFGIYLAFGLALTIIVYAGVRYAASFANEKKLTDSRDRIWAAVIGLLILITSTLILTTINPGILTADPFSKISGASGPNRPAVDENGNQCFPNPRNDSERCPTGESCVAKGVGDKYTCSKEPLTPPIAPGEAYDCSNPKLLSWCPSPNQCKEMGSGIAACLTPSGENFTPPIKIRDYLNPRP